ncbi:MAG: bifunctional phosphoribosyl-AMP cyclohydrolase/phosphoribosyl-ATP diphosphatase HisIE [Xanthomonadales bacterium]|nr:bifunctional phosphoribosyl-AMP cyclohydrolase/phosphoribosyl-ATP diphosphatase HisIE [Gammaproteobacteria bacterium]MBT8054318.1 bifunctional phosphoribosyl-AMP cyclohydrolase/phosphoribosyl-ATP diphosphatase HisIE [Gammaproteobacteria bacterium]NND57489.1 bifunctional phosphoribosyl-AMP cyclohydrolase/phosphoribosyl-ATP diphosphatase HisIE [Xanthomonadales bacterium]NNK51213.1 bifunctional phosphoribosyl-AMP cyclohydrolase/phosphoribosyl-ATP diphosphatase HisIE [Xanthomonadales bacterium]
MLITHTTDIENLDWAKTEGLLPAIVQDAFDGRVLMQAFMSREALEKTLESGSVTFWSRSRRQLWTKGETSGNTLALAAVHADCDRDCLLVMAVPSGPACHRNTDTCFDGDNNTQPQLAFLAGLERLIAQREIDRPEGSYTTRLFEAGIKRISQKVGEEGVETALAATSGDIEELANESADLLYHLLVLLRASGLTLADVTAVLQARHGGQ